MAVVAVVMTAVSGNSFAFSKQFGQGVTDLAVSPDGRLYVAYWTEWTDSRGLYQFSAQVAEVDSNLNIIAQGPSRWDGDERMFEKIIPGNKYVWAVAYLSGCGAQLLEVGSLHKKNELCYGAEEISAFVETNDGWLFSARAGTEARVYSCSVPNLEWNRVLPALFHENIEKIIPWSEKWYEEDSYLAIIGESVGCVADDGRVLYALGKKMMIQDFGASNSAEVVDIAEIPEGILVLSKSTLNPNWDAGLGLLTSLKPDVFQEIAPNIHPDMSMTFEGGVRNMACSGNRIFIAAGESGVKVARLSSSGFRLEQGIAGFAQKVAILDGVLYIVRLSGRVEAVSIEEVDLNGDGQVGLADAILAQQVLAGGKPQIYWGGGKLGFAQVIYPLQREAGLR